MKPKIFVGSSKEGLDIANSIHHNLDNVADCTVWDQGIFLLSRSVMENLVSVLQSSDFGIFVLSPEDIVMMRDVEQLTARDNVVFEAGLFIGYLGLKRTFLVTPKITPKMHLPTDLAGIITATYRVDREDDNLLASLGPACNSITNAIKTVGVKEADTNSHSYLNHQVAAFCYKIVENIPQILLIRTSEKRWLFPKGSLRDSGELWRMAASEAHDEAGVSGKIDEQALTSFRHRKGFRSREIKVIVYMLQVGEQFDPFELNRDPTWFSETEAIRALSEGRDFNLSQELKSVVVKGVKAINEAK